MAKVIGIMGLAGAGKDTVALMLQRCLVGAGATRVGIGGFADYLRKVSKDIGLDPFNRDLKEVEHVVSADTFVDRCWDALEHTVGRLLPARDRAALWAYLFDELDDKYLKDPHATYAYYSISPRQFMQVLGTAGRKIRPTFWIELARRKWEKQDGIVLVTDCRFENEAEVADQVLLIVRSGAALVNPHVSEQLATDLTHGMRSIPGMELIDNNGSLEALDAEVSKVAVSFALLFRAAL